MPFSRSSASTVGSTSTVLASSSSRRAGTPGPQQQAVCGFSVLAETLAVIGEHHPQRLALRSPLLLEAGAESPKLVVGKSDLGEVVTVATGPLASGRIVRIVGLEQVNPQEQRRRRIQPRRPGQRPIDRRVTPALGHVLEPHFSPNPEAIVVHVETPGEAEPVIQRGAGDESSRRPTVPS
jgi:hypothetical protein